MKWSVWSAGRSEMPKGSTFRYVTGIQLRFGDPEERAGIQDYVAYVKKRYKL